MFILEKYSNKKISLYFCISLTEPLEIMKVRFIFLVADLTPNMKADVAPSQLKSFLKTIK
jgi:hypothetical protein